MNLGDCFDNTHDSSGVAVIRKNKRIPLAQDGFAFGYIYEALSVQIKDRIVTPFIVKTLPVKMSKVKPKRVEFEHEGEEFYFRR